jgi:hypothetical protein
MVIRSGSEADRQAMSGEASSGPGRAPAGRATTPIWTFRFVTTAELSLDARALRANPRLNAFWTVMLGLEILLGAAVAVQGFVVGWFFVILGVLFYLYSYVEPVLLWRIRRRQRDSLGREVTVSIDDVAVHFGTSVMSSDVPWSSFTAIWVKPRIVVFMRGRRPMAYLPASVFASADERDEVIAFARARIAANRGTAPVVAGA